MFRRLRADEIELRVGTCTDKGFSLLLYKDARCDMNILDETVGAMNWKREHLRENANCIVSIWDADKGMWVSKEDTGTEPFTEKEKGLASDSFKRACVNWGIGRELYSAPFIWISGHTRDGYNSKYKTDGFDRKLQLIAIGYDDTGCINSLIITDDKDNVVYSFMGDGTPEPMSRKEKEQLVKKLCIDRNKTEESMCSWAGCDSIETMSDDYLDKAIQVLSKGR